MHPLAASEQVCVGTDWNNCGEQHTNSSSQRYWLVWHTMIPLFVVTCIQCLSVTFGALSWFWPFPQRNNRAKLEKQIHDNILVTVGSWLYQQIRNLRLWSDALLALNYAFDKEPIWLLLIDWYELWVPTLWPEVFFMQWLKMKWTVHLVVCHVILCQVGCCWFVWRVKCVHVAQVWIKMSSNILIVPT